ncbi:MAG TPA: GAF and ANTAR domain-containing protein [Frankiaceae bacterium]|jgi:GAF domain-containing protein|nr:GAF and ANTAR domain-containing protein [Frankiaceae bacterium]
MAEGRTPQDTLLDQVNAFAELGGIVFAEHSLEAVMERIAALAKATIPGADEVSVTLVQGKPVTAAATGDLALDVDQAQYAAGAGPCLDAAEAATTVLIPDMATEDRWPEVTPLARDRGAQSSLSIGLPVQQRVYGALNIYSRSPHAFDADAVGAAESFARYAAVAVANATLYQATAALAEQMKEAMSSRAVIDQAKGILMATHGCDSDKAFSLLVTASQRHNRKLREIAQAMVDGVRRDASSGT